MVLKKTCKLKDLHNLEQPHYLILMDQKHPGKYENKYKYYIAQDELQLVYDVEVSSCRFD